MILVGITIAIPIVLIKLNIEMNMLIVPIFVLLYLLFRFMNNNIHKLYLKKEDIEIEEEIEEERKIESSGRKTAKYILILIVTGIALFIISEQLGNSLESLCRLFNVPETIIGILLGFITSIPELITFFESQKHNQKKQEEMLGVIEATNNLLTSNMLNLFIIQTIGIIITAIIL